MNYGGIVVLVKPSADYYFGRAATAQRRIATTDHTASTNPNGHAPCRKP